MKSYLWHIFVALTQLLNTALGGWPDESTSSRLWRLDQQGGTHGHLARKVVDALFFWQSEHCRKSYESERARYQLPPILR
jgi:hypothetical protein